MEEKDKDKIKLTKIKKSKGEEMYLLMFILGTFLGGIFAFCLLCLFVVGKDDDANRQRISDKEKD